MKGYTGKVLLVDLTTGQSRADTIPDEIYRQYLSGSGLATYLLYKYIPAGADPLGPDNILAFSSGLLTGTGMPECGRWMAVAKSPLTGGIGDTNCGGYFSPAIKQCGYDAILVTGAAREPVYLFVDNKGPQILSAEGIWGVMDAVEAADYLVDKHWDKKKPSAVTIGEAGEKLSLIAGINNDRGRMSGRSGLGAVMGSKKLKAVVLAGSKPMTCADPAKIKEYAQYYAKANILSLPKAMHSDMLKPMGKALALAPIHMAMDGALFFAIFRRFGTSYANSMGILNGDDGVKNWSADHSEFGARKWKKLSADRMPLKREVNKYHCYGCIIGCGGECRVNDIKGMPTKKPVHKPEYETINSFGPQLLNDDVNSIYLANELLNRAGMDSISAGGSIGYAIECYEKGLITKEDTGGLELKWGDSAAIIKLLKMMISREGFGDVLADGTKKAVERLGVETDPYAVHAGGQESAQHDGRMDTILATHYATDPTPGRHTIGMDVSYDAFQPWKATSQAPNSNGTSRKDDFTATEMNAQKVRFNTIFKQIVDGVGCCWMAFAASTAFKYLKIPDAINAATGWDMPMDELVNVGDRMQTIRQQFNIKHGVDPWTFKPNGRMTGNPPLKKGPLAGNTVPSEGRMKLTWQVYGWDPETGKPTEETLKKFGIWGIDEGSPRLFEAPAPENPEGGAV